MRKDCDSPQFRHSRISQMTIKLRCTFFHRGELDGINFNFTRKFSGVSVKIMFLLTLGGISLKQYFIYLETQITRLLYCKQSTKTKRLNTNTWVHVY